MVRVTVAEAEAPVASVALSFTEEAPAVVGVPPMTAPDSFRPAGRPVALKVNGAVPPVADSVVE